MMTILELVFPLWPLLDHVFFLLSEHDKAEIFTADTLNLVFVEMLSFQQYGHQNIRKLPQGPDSHIYILPLVDLQESEQRV